MFIIWLWIFTFTLYHILYFFHSYLNILFLFNFSLFIHFLIFFHRNLWLNRRVSLSQSFVDIVTLLNGFSWFYLLSKLVFNSFFCCLSQFRYTFIFFLILFLRVEYIVIWFQLKKTVMLFLFVRFHRWFFTFYYVWI